SFPPQAVFVSLRSGGTATPSLLPFVQRMVGWMPSHDVDRSMQNDYALAAPTVSAITAPRAPSGLFGIPTVVSCAVWCSISRLSTAPISTTMVESHIHIIRPTTAPSAP